MQMADMLFAAATDHRYIQTGHVLDFTNKALEALDIAGWEYAGTVLTSLAQNYATAERMEEANSWRNPLDLVALLDEAFERIPASLEAGLSRRNVEESSWSGRRDLVETLLGDSPQQTIEAMLDACAKDGYRVRDLVHALVQSPIFLGNPKP